jgi:hypothetical protein
MAVFGSPEYVLTWKHWDMESGPQICALRASARRTSDSGCGGWPTPAAQNATGGPNPAGNVGEHFTLQTAAVMAGWQTPTVQDGCGRDRHNQKNGGVILSLLGEAKIAGWPTPNCNERGPESRESKDKRGSGGIDLQSTAILAGWPTCAARDYRDGKSNQHGKNARPLNEVAQLSLLPGENQPLSHVQTAKRGVLNPDLPRWLMAFPAELTKYAPSETQYHPRWRRRS